MGQSLHRSGWWERWWFLALVSLLCAVPLLLPETPPLVDVPGHMARYRIQLDLESSADLQRYFEFEWSLIANLGVDLLMIPLAPLLGLETAVKLIAIMIPILTAAGIFWVSREVHGHVPPTIFFAIPFVYGFPFNFGFLNFSLSIALALLGLALWIRLGRQQRPAVRALLFAPLSCAIWVVHAFGWGMLGLTAWSAEIIRQRDSGHSWPISALRAVLHSIVLALPLPLMVLWRSGDVGGLTTDFFYLPGKAFALVAALRDRWLIWDSFGLALAIMIIGVALIERRFEFARKLAVPALVLTAIFILLPKLLFGSAYADMRLTPLMLILAIAAIRFVPGESFRVRERIALLGLAFFALRLAGNTLSFAISDHETQERLQALDHIPRGARVSFFVGDYHCQAEWPMARDSHLGSFVITRRLGFSNDQWQMPGAQLLRIVYPPAGEFDSDASQFLLPKECWVRAQRPEITKNLKTTDHALAIFPRDAFDYVWMIRPPDFEMKGQPGLIPIWRGRDSILYRIDK